MMISMLFSTLLSSYIYYIRYWLWHRHHVGQLKSMGFNVSGIDISPEGKKAKNYPNCNFKVADVSLTLICNLIINTYTLFILYHIHDQK